MNYIRHLNQVFELFAEDHRLSAHHISLYYSLFQLWNNNRFVNPFQISRQEVMRLSKVGSVNTYTKCLRELHKWNYLNYLPSYNPNKGSLIQMYKFDKGVDKGTDKGTNPIFDKASDKAHEIAVRPFNKHTTKITNITKSEAHARELVKKLENQLDVFTQLEDLKKKERKKVAPKKTIPGSNIPPTMEEVGSFFKEKSLPAKEANKFFHHYTSNGWKVGKAAMENWQASALKWMGNENYLKTTNRKPTPSNLNTKTDKDYAEPL